MKEIKPNPNYKWAVVGMLWFICFFNYADRVAIASVFPLLEKEFHFDKAQLGAIGGAFMLVYALTAPFAGAVGDKYPRKALIIGGLYVWSLVTGFTSLCSKVWQFVFVRGAEGLGETFYFPASMSLVSDYHAPKTRSRAIGLHSTSVYAGTIFGAWFAGFIGHNYGWRVPFVLLGGAGILLGVVLQLFIREPERNQAELEEGGNKDIVAPVSVPIGQFLKEFCQTPTAVLLIVAFFGTNLVN